MIALSAQTRIYLSTSATDMRKGFDGLCGLVSSVLEQDPLSGALFLFMNRRRDRMKVLYWDGDGLAIWDRSDQDAVSSQRILPVKCVATN